MRPVCARGLLPVQLPAAVPTMRRGVCLTLATRRVGAQKSEAHFLRDW